MLFAGLLPNTPKKNERQLEILDKSVYLQPHVLLSLRGRPPSRLRLHAREELDEERPEGARCVPDDQLGGYTPT